MPKSNIQEMTTILILILATIVAFILIIFYLIRNNFKKIVGNNLNITTLLTVPLILGLVACTQKGFISSGTAQLGLAYLGYIYAILWIIPLEISRSCLYDKDYKFSLTRFLISCFVIVIFGASSLALSRWGLSSSIFIPEWGLVVAFFSGNLSEYLESKIGSGQLVPNFLMASSGGSTPPGLNSGSEAGSGSGAGTGGGSEGGREGGSEGESEGGSGSGAGDSDGEVSLGPTELESQDSNLSDNASFRHDIPNLVEMAIRDNDNIPDITRHVISSFKSLLDHKWPHDENQRQVYVDLLKGEMEAVGLSSEGLDAIVTDFPIPNGTGHSSAPENTTRQQVPADETAPSPQQANTDEEIPSSPEPVINGNDH